MDDRSSNHSNEMDRARTEEDRDADDASTQQERPLCSVLNTVVDHVMIPPTPLEPQEYQQSVSSSSSSSSLPQQATTVENSTTSSAQQQQHSYHPNNVLVPVLRIFGPILRRRDSINSSRTLATTTTTKEPLQSACLYIHGAFPYLLARPVMAGPDGSLHHRSSHNSSNSNATTTARHYADWDDVASVGRILPFLQERLEATIQSSMQDFAGGGGAASGSAAAVVNARGNGSSNNNNKTTGCPVIRNLRVVVGRGFYTFCPGPPAPFVRVEYYDPSQRWRVKAALEKGLDALPQICLPDPLQYQDLALQQLRDDGGDDYEASQDDDDDEPLCFHCYEAHIPYTMQFFKDYNLAGMSYIHVSADALFRRPLPASVRSRCFVGSNDQKQHVNNNLKEEEVLFLASNTPTDSMWAAISTTETDRPEASSIDGPALPQMASLQQPSPPASGTQLSDDDNNDDDDDDNNKSEWVISPSDVTCFRNESGPWTNKETSCDVELDIHVDHILNVQDVMTSLPKDETEREQIHWRAVPSLREIWREERRRMAKLLPPQNDFLSKMTQDDDDEDATTKTPPFTLNVKKDSPLPGSRLAREGMQRLVRVTEGLEENFRRTMKDIIDRHDDSVTRVDDLLKQQQQQQRSQNNKAESGDLHLALTPTYDETLQALGALGSMFDATNGVESSSTPSPHREPNHQIKERTGPSNSPLAGELGQRGSVSPEHEEQRLSQDECDDSFGRNSFEFSQRVDRGDCIVNGPCEHVEDFIDPETLTPYETFDDEDVPFGGNEEDEMDAEQLEQTLLTLATQKHGTVVEAFEEDPYEHAMMTQVSTVEASQRLEASTDSEDEISMSGPGTSLHPAAGEMLVDDHGAPELLDKSTTGLQWPHSADASVTRREKAPLRRDMIESNSTELYPMQSVGDQPQWLAFSSEYERIYRPSHGRADWFPHIAAAGVSICPIRPAPTRKKVSSWSRKRFKRTRDSFDDSGRKRSKTGGTTEQYTMGDLRLDENSRKLVFDSTSDQVGPKVNRQDVEEVEWHSSQNVALSLTQHTQGDETATYQSGIVAQEEMEGSCKSSNVNGQWQQSSESATDSLSKSTPESTLPAETPTPDGALRGIGNQGGRIWVAGGGQLKAKTRPSQRQSLDSNERQPPSVLQKKEQKDSQYLASPISVMALEVHVQCRTGRAGVNDSKEIAMTPVPDRDKVFAIAYTYGRDPGGGETLQVLERGCLFTPVERELQLADTENCGAPVLTRLSDAIRRSMPREAMGRAAPFSVECVRDEKHLLLRFASIVRLKDPDMLLSWDTQGAGLGYLIERGISIGKRGDGSRAETGNCKGEEAEIDMARLLGRTPAISSKFEANGTCKINRNNGNTKELTAVPDPFHKGEDNPKASGKWRGSGLGSDWDERVGAGAAAASIVGRLVFAGWKVIAEEVKHPNASYLPAVVATVLGKRIPFHSNYRLTQWYGHANGRDRWRVIHHKLTQATACLLLFDALDIIGRAGEAARLSGVEFSQSFPGIRGSQYKVEGVLLRALQSLNSEERGSKRGRKQTCLKLSSAGGSSLSEETKSQTQSPWKARRLPSSNKRTDDAVDKPLHGLSDRCYFFFSPSLHDTNKQEALAVQALTLEPQSGHQQDPVIVCDFTALYPSLVIAYNLCYSTAAGHLEYHSTRNEMRLEGRTTGKLGPFRYSCCRTATVLKHHMKSLTEGENNKDRAYAAPTGTVYVSESVVKGVLPQVLDEILSTRAMLKKAAKEYKRLVPDLSPSILRQLEARQLALKYVANVTYGYTSATFSGRCAMPLLADTIVECGRRTLTNAINLANSWGRQRNGRWRGCEVIYGDTDSVFVKLPGRSVQEAFQFGEEFCRAVTASNPPPVQLKLEKVYLGSIMQTKKKYCGMKFETKDQKKPTFEAKGLETVRRDQCALTQKILRNSLVTLFRSGIDAVKNYLYRQWALILSGKLPVSDFILTGRVRSRYRGGRVGPVQASLAQRLAETDPGMVIRHKERLAYVIVSTPGTSFRLRDCVLTPMELLEQWDAYSIHSAYYITKHVNAALQRCLGLAPHKIDVSLWYSACPKPRRRIHFWPITRSGNSIMISSYFGSDMCSLCGKKCMARGRSRAAVCPDCRSDDVGSLEKAMRRLNNIQQEAHTAASRCSRCNLCFEDASTFASFRVGQHREQHNPTTYGARQGAGVVTPLANCSCIDCPVTFERHRLREAELEAMALCEALDAL